MSQPNVLFITVDDLKPVLGCYGDRVVKSPNIDRLAARGVVFDRAYCNQAVCAPPRDSLMTGVRPTTLGIHDLGTKFRESSPKAVTHSQYFMKHGYRAEAPKRFDRFDAKKDSVLSREEFITAATGRPESSSHEAGGGAPMG